MKTTDIGGVFMVEADDEMPEGAVAVVSNLDMLTDEPLELAVALRRLAESKAGDKVWARFAEKMVELEHDLKALNEPGHGADAEKE
jgi:hypothetical protein